MEEKTVILVINAPNLRPITIACGENETIAEAKKKFYYIPHPNHSIHIPDFEKHIYFYIL